MIKITGNKGDPCAATIFVRTLFIHVSSGHPIIVIFVVVLVFVVMY